jgi:hypothetical protein
LTHNILEKVGDKCDIKLVRYTKQGEQATNSTCNYLINTIEQ